MLDRLALVGSNGAGALEYEPAEQWSTILSAVSLDEIAEACYRTLNYDDSSDDIESIALPLAEKWGKNTY